MTRAHPDFAVVGAAKAGTTSLSAYLRQHPQVFVPAHEEPSFFAFDGAPPTYTGADGRPASVNRYAVTDRLAYQELFQEAGAEQITGDISPAYLYVPSSARRLHGARPDVRIIAVLRHPVDRAFSAFMHARREGREPLADFRSAVEAEPERIAANCGLLWRYVDLGFYARDLRRYYELFGPEQVYVRTFEELQRDPVGLCRGLQRWLGVDETFEPDVSALHNVSGLPRSRLLHRTLRSPLASTALKAVAPAAARERLRNVRTRLQARNLQRQRLSSADRSWLLPRFVEDITQLADLTGLDVSPWLQPQDQTSWTGK